MERFAYLVDLRERIAHEINGVEDASFSLFWDDAQPNYLTHSRLLRLFELARNSAEAFAVYLSVRHCDCGSRPHRRHPDGYVMEPIGGRILSYRDPAFDWDTLDQVELNQPCPCTSSKISKRHRVIYDLLYDNSADQAFRAAVRNILSDLYEAALQAGDKRPRSGIREHLLRALITVNDHIRPDTLEEYIETRTALGRR